MSLTSSLNGGPPTDITATTPNTFPVSGLMEKPSTFLLDSVRSCSQGMLQMFIQGLKIYKLPNHISSVCALAYHIVLLHFSSMHSPELCSSLCFPDRDERSLCLSHLKYPVYAISLWYYGPRYNPTQDSFFRVDDAALNTSRKNGTSFACSSHAKQVR
jgi:hypothetical protein